MKLLKKFEVSSTGAFLLLRHFFNKIPSAYFSSKKLFAHLNLFNLRYLISIEFILFVGEMEKEAKIPELFFYCGYLIKNKYVFKHFSSSYSLYLNIFVVLLKGNSLKNLWQFP